MRRVRRQAVQPAADPRNHTRLTFAIGRDNGLRTPPRILAVDDVPTNLDILRHASGVAGYEVVTAADGERRWRGCAIRTRLVLLDIMMPKLDGISALKQIKKDAGSRFIPVILVTAKADTRDVVAGLEAAAMTI